MIAAWFSRQETTVTISSSLLAQKRISKASDDSLTKLTKAMSDRTRRIGTRNLVGSGFSHPRRSQNPGRGFCSDCGEKNPGNDDAALGCQPERFDECYAQRVCHLVEEVDLQHVDLGVAFDDIRHCLHDLASVLGFELALHAMQVFAQIH